MGQPADGDPVHPGKGDGPDIGKRDTARGLQLRQPAADAVTCPQDLIEAFHKKNGPLQFADREIIQQNPVGNESSFEKMSKFF